MALIKCPECGKEFSSYADKCPNCGCPMSVVEEINQKRLKILEREEEKRKKKEAEEDLLIKGYYRDGNSIYFGSYYQSNDYYKEPIQWNILKEENGKALIISDRIIDVLQFDKDSNNYEKSYVRKWLNDDFYNNAFDANEKRRVETTLVDNSLESTTDEHNEDVCDNTNDKIFLLSVKEVKTYLKSDIKREAICTNYSRKKGLSISCTANGSWWLRSPYRGSYASYEVDEHGSIDFIYFDQDGFGVRPALWINLSKSIDLQMVNTRKKVENTTPFKKCGKKIYFGSYYQSNDYYKEPIQWNILKEENGKALIISDKIIDVSQFDEYSNNYEKSYVRKWLNDDFYNNAFDANEKKRIETTLVDNSLESTMEEDNDYVCDDTNDKIFLLSVKEVDLYYKNMENRQAIGTEYAKKKGLLESEEWFYQGKCDWILRSPSGDEDIEMYLVDSKGEIGYANVDFIFYGLRPALWITLKLRNEPEKWKK